MKATEGKNSFVMYGSFLEAAETLNGDDFKECILKLRDYALYDETDIESKNPTVNAILVMALPILRAAAERYDRCVRNGKKGGEFGSRGGRPRKGETKEEYELRKELEKTPRKPLNGNDTGNGNENEKGNGKENEDVEDSNLKYPEENSLEKPSFLPFPSSYLSSSPLPLPEEQAPKEQASEEQGITQWLTEEEYNELKNKLYLLARHNLGLKKVNNPQALYNATLNRVCEFWGCAKDNAEPWVERQIQRFEEEVKRRSSSN